MALTTWQSNPLRKIEVGEKGKLATKSSWYGVELPDHIVHVGDETRHYSDSSFEVKWRVWWKYLDGSVDSIILDADLPHDQRVVTALTTMRMSYGNNSEGQGGSAP